MSDTASSHMDEFDSDDSSETTCSSSSPHKSYRQAGRTLWPTTVYASGAKLQQRQPQQQLCAQQLRTAAGQRFNLVQKLNMRQVYGKVRDKGRGPEMKMFSRLPGRLAFCIRDVVPQSALLAGHIFMGFSSCGQFLLSYTQTTTENDVVDLNFNYYYRLHWWMFVPYAKARKVAEVTLFTDQGVYGNLNISISQWPGDISRLVVYGCQSMEGELEDRLAPSGSLHCYLTVTAAPSLTSCQECVKVAGSYDADDVAAAWNSCMRLSCLRHGATVHTQFDLVPPYPKFQPKISLKRSGCVVLNTGNFLHSFTVDLEKLRGDGERCDEKNAPSTSSFDQLHESSQSRSATAAANMTASSALHNPISVRILSDAEFSLGGYPSPCSSSQHAVTGATSDSETTTDGAESDSSASTTTRTTKGSSRAVRKSRRPLDFMMEGRTAQRLLRLSNNSNASHQQQSEKREKIKEFLEKLSPGKRRIGGGGAVEHLADSSSLLVQTVRPQSEAEKNKDSEAFEFTVPCTRGTSERKRRLAEEAYELTDDNFASDLPATLSIFRRKRLADKKYEFTEDDESEQRAIVPLTRLRSKKLAEVKAANSKSTDDSGHAAHEADSKTELAASAHEEEENKQVEEQEAEEQEEEEDCWTDMLEGTSYPELFSPGGCIKKDVGAMSPRLYQQAMSPKLLSTCLSPRATTTNTNTMPEFQCRAKFTRRYIEVDDDLISVITDVEDDDLGASTGFHTALPLEVHGSGYNQMQMISNAKAERLNLHCVRVQQRSLDLEQFCHETATRLCAAVDKKFWFINDYDVELVDVDPDSGYVVAVAVVLIQAAIITKSSNLKYNVSSLHRKQYQASFKFCWSLDSGQYSVVDSDPLKEVNMFKEPGGIWGPARYASAPLIRMFNCQAQCIRTITNESVMQGVSLKAIVDSSNLVALIMNDLE